MVSQKENKRVRILEAAKVVFSEDGYHGATVDRIAERAGVAKGTVYLYFTSKTELFWGVVEYGFSIIEESIKKAMEEIDDPMERIEKGVFSFAEYMEKNKELFLTLMYEPPSLKIPEMRKRFIKRMRKIQKIIEDVIEEGIEKKIFKPINKNVIASVVMGMVRGVVFRNIFLEKGKNLKEVVSEVVEIMKNGILRKEEE